MGKVDDEIIVGKDLKQHLENALEREPRVDAKDIGVSVDEGVLTLRGNVASYTEKIVAEREAGTPSRDSLFKRVCVVSSAAELDTSLLVRSPG